MHTKKLGAPDSLYSRATDEQGKMVSWTSPEIHNDLFRLVHIERQMLLWHQLTSCSTSSLNGVLLSLLMRPTTVVSSANLTTRLDSDSAVQSCVSSVNNTYEHYEGSIVKAAEKCITSVQGGRAEYTAALAWEKRGVSPNSTTYQNWIKSTIDNPTVIDFELLPLVNLVRGFSCALTKRRHLHRALEEYQTEFDSCKCAPCPNNARPALSGTECICICQTGTYGPNCEKRARDYTADEVDGRWSCWSIWSTCDSTLKKHRSRSCNNPAPQQGGRPCQGSEKQVEECTISIFQTQNVCINDDDFETEGSRESQLPPGASGCPKPRPPDSSCKLGEMHDGTKCVCMSKENAEITEQICVSLTLTRRLPL